MSISSPITNVPGAISFTVDPAKPEATLNFPLKDFEGTAVKVNVLTKEIATQMDPLPSPRSPIDTAAKIADAIHVPQPVPTEAPVAPVVVTVLKNEPSLNFIGELCDLGLKLNLALLVPVTLITFDGCWYSAKSWTVIGSIFGTNQSSLLSRILPLPTTWGASTIQCHTGGGGMIGLAAAAAGCYASKTLWTKHPRAMCLVTTAWVITAVVVGANFGSKRY